MAPRTANSGFHFSTDGHFTFNQAIRVSLANVPRSLDPLLQYLAVNKLDVTPLGEVVGSLREAARCNDKATCGPLGSHYAVKLADNGDADPKGTPLFALDQILFSGLKQSQIDASIGTQSGVLDNLKTSPAKSLSGELFELLPRQTPY